VAATAGDCCAGQLATVCSVCLKTKAVKNPVLSYAEIAAKREAALSGRLSPWRGQQNLLADWQAFGR